jgi:hypothetical protein
MALGSFASDGGPRAVTFPLLFDSMVRSLTPRARPRRCLLDRSFAAGSAAHDAEVG